jgi:hypothetical protein
MAFILYLLAATSLLSIAYQDFKDRAVYWFLFLFLFMVLGILSIIKTGIEQTGMNLLLNSAFVTLQLLLATTYFSIKNCKLTNIFANYFGVGDLLFLFSVSAGFSFVNFIAFYIVSLLLTILLFIAVVIKQQNRAYQIPLAGAQALFYLLLLSVNTANNSFNLLNDSKILSLFSINQ